MVRSSTQNNQSKGLKNLESVEERLSIRRTVRTSDTVEEMKESEGAEFRSVTHDLLNPALMQALETYLSTLPPYFRAALPRTPRKAWRSRLLKNGYEKASVPSGTGSASFGNMNMNKNNPVILIVLLA